jgi:malate synthase
MGFSFTATSPDLTAIPEGTRTDYGFRHNISVTLGTFCFLFSNECIVFSGYLDSWLRGVGCVPLYNLMEDAATAEISRAQLWQWLKHEARLEDGSKVDVQLLKQTIAAETERR